MIGQELILLGLLKESPKHGYEIKKQIKDILSLFAGVNLKSIYYPLRVLEKNGLVIKRAARQGRRPQRFIYALTPKGQSRFKKLLAESFLDFSRPQFSLDLSLYFLNYINPRLAKRRLNARIFILHKLSGDLRQMIESPHLKGSFSLTRILRHNLQMLEADSQFLNSLLETL